VGPVLTGGDTQDHRIPTRDWPPRDRFHLAVSGRFRPAAGGALFAGKWYTFRLTLTFWFSSRKFLIGFQARQLS